MPMLANTARLVLVVAGGALVMQLGGPLWALFAVIALGLSVVGGLTGLRGVQGALGARLNELRPTNRSARPALRRAPRPSASGRKAPMVTVLESAIALASSCAARGGVIMSRAPRTNSAGHFTFAAASMPPA